MFGFGLIKGLSVTLRRCFSKPNTVEYPEERLPVGPMFRGGTIDLNLDKCIACGLCAMACPNSAIDLATEKPKAAKRFCPAIFITSRSVCTAIIVLKPARPRRSTGRKIMK